MGPASNEFGNLDATLFPTSLMKILRLLLPALVGLMCLTQPGPAWAQASPFQAADEQFKDRDGNLNYVAPLRTLLAGKTQFDPDAYKQALATFYSFVGETSPAAQSPDSGPWAYKLADPTSFITSRANATRVVIINEDHTQPGHRAFSQELLRLLAPLGYRYLAVEALNPADMAINTRKYPISSTGYYTSEPTMGRLLRTASATGFQIFGHEITQAQEQEFADWRKRSQYRDSMQAVNILAVLTKNPQTKILVHVGHDHVLEKTRDDLKRMATYLRELGQLDPLTIDQTTPYRAAGPVPTTPRLLTTNGRIPVTVGFNAQLVDLQVVHPPLANPGSRPAWLTIAAADKLTQAAIPAPYAGTRCLAQLYDLAEYQKYGDRAVPLDQYLIAATQKQIQLYALFPKQRVVVKYRPAEFR